MIKCTRIEGGETLTRRSHSEIICDRCGTELTWDDNYGLRAPGVDYVRALAKARGWRMGVRRGPHYCSEKCERGQTDHSSYTKEKNR